MYQTYPIWRKVCSFLLPSGDLVSFVALGCGVDAFNLVGSNVVIHNEKLGPYY